MKYAIFIVFSLEALASAYIPHEQPTCQFRATILAYIDQTIDDPSEIGEFDPELKFFKEIMKLRDDDIQHIADDAVKFFNERYGLDFSLSPPSNESIYVENATVVPFKLAKNIDIIVNLNNWIQTGSTGSTCYRIYDGGFSVVFSGTQLLHGSYGGVDGVLVGETQSLTYGYRIIDVCKQSPVILQYQSATPVRQEPVDGAIPLNFDIYSTVFGYGKELGYASITPDPDEPGRFRFIARTVYTF